MKGGILKLIGNITKKMKQFAKMMKQFALDKTESFLTNNDFLLR